MTESGPVADDAAAFATAPYRARFDECGPDGSLRPSAYLRWAQDVAWIHSERLGFGRDWYTERRLAWLVRAVDLTLLIPVPTGMALDVTTRVVGWRHVLARRRTDFVDSQGRLVAWGLTDWVMTDDAGSPTRVPGEFPARFAVRAASFMPTRVPLGEPPRSARSTTLTVRPHEIDPMGHVNNAVYLDYAFDALAADGPARPARTSTSAARGPASASLPLRVRLEYLVAAEPFDDLVAHVWPNGAETCVLLVRSGHSRSAGFGTPVEPLVRCRIGRPLPEAD